MKFSILSLLLTATVASAGVTTSYPGPADTRDVEGALRTVSTSVRLLNRVVDDMRAASRTQGRDLRSYEQNIVSQGNQLTVTMRSAADKVRRIRRLAPPEGTSLFPTVDGLARDTAKLSDALVQNKRLFVSTGGRDVIIKLLQDHEAAAAELGDAVSSTAAGSTAGTAAKARMSIEFRKAIVAYKAP